MSAAIMDSVCYLINPCFVLGNFLCFIFIELLYCNEFDAFI
jgi:hypothetical protein